MTFFIFINWFVFIVIQSDFWLSQNVRKRVYRAYDMSHDCATATCRSTQFLPSRSFTVAIHRGLEIKGHHLLEITSVRVCLCLRWERVRALPHLFRLTESVAFSDLLMDMEREHRKRGGGEMGRAKSRQHFNCFSEKKKGWDEKLRLPKAIWWNSNWGNGKTIWEKDHRGHKRGNWFSY